MVDLFSHSGININCIIGILTLFPSNSTSSSIHSQGSQRTLSSLKPQDNLSDDRKNSPIQSAIQDIAENLGNSTSLSQALPKSELPFTTKHDYEEKTHDEVTYQNQGRIFTKVNASEIEGGSKKKVVGYFDLSSAKTATIDWKEYDLTDLKGTIPLKDSPQKLTIAEAGYRGTLNLIIPKKSDLTGISQVDNIEVELKYFEDLRGWVIKTSPKNPSTENNSASQGKNFVLANNNQLAEDANNQGIIVFCAEKRDFLNNPVKQHGITKITVDDFSESDKILNHTDESQPEFKKKKYSEPLNLGDQIGSGYQADIFRIRGRKDSNGQDSNEVVKKAHQRSYFNSSNGMIRRDVWKQKFALGPKAINYRFEKHHGERSVVLPKYDRTLGIGLELDIMKTGSKDLRDSYIQQMNEIYQSIKRLERLGSLITVSDIKPDNFLVKFSIDDKGKPAVNIVAADLKIISRHLTNAAKNANLKISKENKKSFKDDTGIHWWRAGMSAAFLYEFGRNSPIMEISKDGFRTKPLKVFE